MDLLDRDAALPRGIICVIRAASADDALLIARGVSSAGVDAIEITFTVPGAEDAIRAASSIEGLSIGAGTVRTEAQVGSALGAGARFIVSPALDARVVSAAHAAGAPAVPGALTPGEVEECLATSSPFVKVFPVGAMGGPGYIKALAEPFPEARWVVSGGIGPSDVARYFDVGCHAVCLGGALIDRAAVRRGDLDAVAEHAAHVLATVGAARS